MQICIIYHPQEVLQTKTTEIFFWWHTVQVGFLTCCLFAGGQGVSGPESSVFCGFPCSSASVALHWCSSHWNRVLSDGARKGRFYCITSFSHPSSTCLCADILSVGSIYLYSGVQDEKLRIFWIESLVWTGAYISGSASSGCERSRESCSLCCCSGSPSETALTGPGVTGPQRIWKRIRLLQETGRWGCCTL